MPEKESRVKAIAAEINSMRLDVIGFQETEEWLEVRRTPPVLEGEWIVVSDKANCPVYVRSDKFERIPWNGKEAIGMTLPGSVRSRYGSAAYLRRKSDGFEFVFATIHPSNNGESNQTQAGKDRIRQAEAVWNYLEQWGVTGKPILIVGDTNDRNMPPKGLPGVFVKHGMTDVLQKLKQKPRIDRAFVQGFDVHSATVNPVASSVSDHDFGLFVVSPTAPPPPGPLHGVDVSSHQGADWIPAPGDTFAMVKCSEGTTYTNPVRWSQISAARTAGMVTGHYHFMWPGRPIEQARFFVDNVGALAGEPLWCDWETTGGGHPSVDDAAKFIAEVQRLLPENRVGLYCNESDWLTTTVKAGDGLWIARYGAEPKTLTKWIFHQYTDTPIDKNWSQFTSVDDLKAWCHVQR
jgi:hypothetical protein